MNFLCCNNFNSLFLAESKFETPNLDGKLIRNLCQCQFWNKYDFCIQTLEKWPSPNLKCLPNRIDSVWVFDIFKRDYYPSAHCFYVHNSCLHIIGSIFLDFKKWWGEIKVKFKNRYYVRISVGFSLFSERTYILPNCRICARRKVPAKCRHQSGENIK